MSVIRRNPPSIRAGDLGTDAERRYWRDADVPEPVREAVRQGVVVPADLHRGVVEAERARIVDHLRESRISRARGLALAISDCRDDARMDGIREIADEIARLLGHHPGPEGTGS